MVGRAKRIVLLFTSIQSCYFCYSSGGKKYCQEMELPATGGKGTTGEGPRKSNQQLSEKSSSSRLLSRDARATVFYLDGFESYCHGRQVLTFIDSSCC